MKKVLFVDDSATARAIFRACLPKDGSYQLFEAKDDVTAVNIAKLEQPTICVMDYNLPEKNGIAIAQLIIESGLDPKFVLMTANMQDAIIERAKQLGFLLFVEKPITVEKVKKMLEDLQ